MTLLKLVKFVKQNQNCFGLIMSKMAIQRLSSEQFMLTYLKLENGTCCCVKLIGCVIINHMTLSEHGGVVKEPLYL